MQIRKIISTFLHYLGAIFDIKEVFTTIQGWIRLGLSILIPSILPSVIKMPTWAIVLLWIGVFIFILSISGAIAIYLPEYIKKETKKKERQRTHKRREINKYLRGLNSLEIEINRYNDSMNSLTEKVASRSPEYYHSQYFKNITAIKEPLEQTRSGYSQNLTERIVQHLLTTRVNPELRKLVDNELSEQKENIRNATNLIHDTILSRYVDYYLEDILKFSENITNARLAQNHSRELRQTDISQATDGIREIQAKIYVSKEKVIGEINELRGKYNKQLEKNR